MKIKKMIVISACMILLAGCANDTREEHAEGFDAVNMAESIESVEENPNISGEEMGENPNVSAGVEEAAGVQDEVTEETLPEIYRCEQNDAYKLFYGTWEITQIISEHRRDGRREGWEDILGMQVTYLPDRYEFGGIVTVDHPTYLMSIFPNGIKLMSDNLRQNAVGEETLLPDNGVFVWVQIVNMPVGVETGRSYGFEAYVGSEFFIKDANTLYCSNYECLYEMKRVSYDEVSEEEAESVPRDDRHYHYKQNDAYSLFYGTWEIADIVSESRYLGGDEGCEDILGMQVTYLPDQYELGGSVTVEDPNYLISILPTDSRLLFDQRQVSMDTLLPDSDYFVWVQIADIPNASETGMGYGFGPYVDNGFFIKDDNTLYLFAYHCIYEMNRVSYMDGYDPNRALSYRER